MQKDDATASAATAATNFNHRIHRDMDAASRKKEGRKRHGARNQHRHRDFVKWLQAYFPDSFQKSDCRSQLEGEKPMHILDVAGGKGELSARLCMCLLQNVVMVDPRPADVADCFESLVYPKIPNKVCCILNLY